MLKRYLTTSELEEVKKLYEMSKSSDIETVLLAYSLFKQLFYDREYLINIYAFGDKWVSVSNIIIKHTTTTSIYLLDHCCFTIGLSNLLNEKYLLY